MSATQAMCAVPAVAFHRPLAEAFGEAVRVTPRHSGTLDDRVFASHASFAWRVATMILAQGAGGVLRYRMRRLVATFGANDVARLQPGDRLTRTWDGAVFEVTAAYREGHGLCCELVELEGRIH